MKFEAKSEDLYSSIKYTHVGSIGNQVSEKIIKWLESKNYQAY